MDDERSGAIPDRPAEEPNGTSVELADDFYVTLQPLTLELVATQLDRIGIRYDRQPDKIVAGWESYVIETRISPDHVLAVRATIRQGFPAATAILLAGRCNWWNATRLFLKASVATIVVHPDEPGDDAAPVPVVRVRLDFELPLQAGVAPVQLQALFRGIVGNMADVLKQFKLDELTSRELWG